MTQITSATVPSRGVCNLKVDITSGATTPTVDISPKEAVMYQVDNDPGNDVLLTSLVMNIGAKRKSPTTEELIGERMWLTGGEIVTNSAGDEVVRYTGTYRGLSDVFSAVPTAADAFVRNQIAHNEGEVCTIAADWLFRMQANTYLAGSSTISRAYGETIAANKPWMFGSSPNESKIFEYDGTNPAQGLTLEAGVLDDVKVVATFGYKQADFPGSWTPGVLYVDTDATFNQSPTATSLPFGQILNDTSGNSDVLQITGFAPSDLGEMTKAQAQNPASEVFASISGQMLGHALQGNLSTYDVDTSGTDDYLISLTPEISALVDGMIFSFEAGAANTGPATLNVISDNSGAITAFSDAGGGEVNVESVGHGLSTSDIAEITGTTNYNGVFVITKVDDDNYKITDTWVADDATGTWNSALGAKTIKKRFDVDLETGDVVEGQKILVQYDSIADTFQMLSADAQEYAKESEAVIKSADDFYEARDSTETTSITGSLYVINPMLDSTDYEIEFDTNVEDSFFLTSTPNQADNEVVINTSSTYALSGQVRVDSNISRTYTLNLKKNGVTILTNTLSFEDGTITVSGSAALLKDDVLTLELSKTGGNNAVTLDLQDIVVQLQSAQ